MTFPIVQCRRILEFAMGACIVYYIFMTASCRGDFQGDSWEYLGKASQIKTEGSTPYTYLRGFLYPWFLATTWGKDGLVTYLAQNGIFLGSLYAALRFVAFGSPFGLVAILA